ncbi:MAG: hypothetical protein E6Q50_01820 [Lysobacter sp.]|nr:MAG: hypothetical protein E6Q50_01820 [Lysobacter sp.]
MSGWKKAGLAAAFVVAIATTWFLARRTGPDIAPVVDEAAVAPPPVAATELKAIPSAPLPPLDAPLESVLDDLRRRANAGEPAAACRLAAEYSHCDELPYRRADDQRWLAQRQVALQAIPNPDVRAIAMKNIEREMAERGGRLDTIERHCASVRTPSPQESVELWRRAALLGHPAAMRQYASGNAFRTNRLMDALPMLDTYKREAESIARKLAAQGDFSMAVALAAGYNPSPIGSRSLLAQTLKPDGAMSLALYELAKRSLPNDGDLRYASLRRDIDTAIEDLRANLSPDDLARSRDLSAKAFVDWKPLEVKGAPERISTTGTQRDVHRASCATAADGPAMAPSDAP